MLKRLLLAAALFAATTLPAHANEKQITCLAQNAYHEAGNQGLAGMEAVTHVVMNRVKDKRFPNTPCDVIKQRSKKACQFSWVCSHKTVTDDKLYKQAVVVVRRVYYNMTVDRTRGALYFHEKHSKPSWRSAMRLSVRIGDHTFYKG